MDSLQLSSLVLLWTLVRVLSYSTEVVDKHFVLTSLVLVVVPCTCLMTVVCEDHWQYWLAPSMCRFPHGLPKLAQLFHSVASCMCVQCLWSKYKNIIHDKLYTPGLPKMAILWYLLFPELHMRCWSLDFLYGVIEPPSVVVTLCVCVCVCVCVHERQHVNNTAHIHSVSVSNITLYLLLTKYEMFNFNLALLAWRNQPVCIGTGFWYLHCWNQDILTLMLNLVWSSFVYLPNL